MPKKLSQIEAEKNVQEISLIKRYIFDKFTYKNNRTKINMTCWCGNSWSLSYTNLVNQKQGCPMCAGNIKLSQDEAERRVYNICKLKLFKHESFIYKNNSSIINLSCHCGKTWKSSYVNLVNNKTGCPKCSNNMKLTHTEMENKIIEKCINMDYTYEPFISYNTNKTKISISCNCGRNWKCTYNDFINKNSNCPSCKGKIHNILYFFVIRNENNEIISIKFGIASDDYKNRLRFLNKKLKKYNKNYKAFYSCHIKFSESVARELETVIKQKTIEHGFGNYFNDTTREYNIPYTETRSINSLECICSIVNEHLDTLKTDRYMIYHVHNDDCILWEKIF